MIEDTSTRGSLNEAARLRRSGRRRAGVPDSSPVAARAQQAPKVPQIVFFSPFATDDIRVHSFRQGLSDLGHVDGKDIWIGTLVTPPDQASRQAAGFRTHQPSAIVVATTPFALAAKRATATIPDHRRGRSRPCGNWSGGQLGATGTERDERLSNLGADMTGKRLELLKNVVPGLARVATLIDPDDPASLVQLAQARGAAAILGLDLRQVEARPVDHLDRLVAAAAAGEVQALAVTQAFAHSSITASGLPRLRSGSGCPASSRRAKRCLPAGSWPMERTSGVCIVARRILSTGFSRVRRQRTVRWSCRRCSSCMWIFRTAKVIGLSVPEVHPAPRNRGRRVSRRADGGASRLVRAVISGGDR